VVEGEKEKNKARNPRLIIMNDIIDKEILGQILTTQEFKEWLISRRWFSHKSELSDMQFEVELDYFEVIDGNIIITIIKITKLGYDKSYFVPFIYFKDLANFLEENERVEENLLKLQENAFVGAMNLIEAEYCLLFWKKIFSKINFVVDLDERFQYFIDVSKDPNKYHFSLKQLGEGNTTNLLFKVKIRKKDLPDQKLASLVVKSYKNYIDNLEILKLTALMKNDFKQAPKLVGSIKIKDHNTIGIVENVSNIGNIGFVYWKELNDMIFNVFEDLNGNYSQLEDKNHVFELITRQCVTSLEFSSKIGQIIKKMHGALTVSDSENEIFHSEFVKSQKFLEPRVSKIHSIIINLKFTIKQLTTNSFFDISQINSILNDVSEILGNLLFRIRDLSIKIQPIHQDLHMEQVLYDIVNDRYEFYFTDFEGDPQLSPEGKKKKLPVEKDMASFLRSLSYIKYNTLLGYINEKVTKSESEESPEKILHDLLLLNQQRGKIQIIEILLRVLNIWENKLTEIILRDLESNLALQDFFTIERTLQEINYEILYRPDKIIVPLLGLKEMLRKK